jgi:hypothetical protein
MSKIDAAHPASFWRELEKIEREQAASRPRKTISRGLARQAGRALSAACARRALLSDERVAFWAEEVITAGSDEAARGVIGTINSLHGLDGPGPGDDGDDDDLSLEHLWPVQPGRSRQWQASKLAAAARRDLDAYDDDDDDLGEFASLWPARTPEEATARHEAAQILAAARRDANDGELSDAEWTRLFGAPPPKDRS